MGYDACNPSSIDPEKISNMYTHIQLETEKERENDKANLAKC